MLLCSLLCRHARQQTEIVFFHGDLPTSRAKLTLGTMRVQHQFGRCADGLPYGDLSEYDLSERGEFPKMLRQNKGVESQQQSFMCGDFFGWYTPDRHAYIGCVCSW